LLALLSEIPLDLGKISFEIFLVHFNQDGGQGVQGEFAHLGRLVTEALEDQIKDLALSDLTGCLELWHGEGGDGLNYKFADELLGVVPSLLDHLCTDRRESLLYHFEAALDHLVVLGLYFDLGLGPLVDQEAYV